MKSTIIKLALANLIAFLLYFIYLQFQSKPEIEDKSTPQQEHPNKIPSIKIDPSVVEPNTNNGSTKIDEPKVENKNSSQYEYQIKAIIVSANNYLNKSAYEQNTHTDIMSQLLLLYDIKGLSDEQNSGLREAIRAMKRKEQKHFAPPPVSKPKPTETTKATETTAEKTPDKQKNEKPNESKGKKKIKDFEVTEEFKTLFSIAKKFNMSLERLKELNPSVKDDNIIKIGQILKVEEDDN